MAREEPWWEAIRPLFAGRRVVVTTDVAAAATPIVAALRRLGVRDVLVIAGGDAGTGTLPDPAHARLVCLNATGPTFLDAHRAGEAALADLPASAAAVLDGFDPDGTALVLGDFLGSLAALAGRPYFAYRRPEWVALDDKVTIDAFWDRAGVARSPSEVVPARAAAAVAAASRLDRGDGVVLAADASRGWHGGAEHVRRARGPAAVADAVARLAAVADLVRVMPFVEGVPCSIHGVVLPDRVIVLRPVEMIVLRRADGTFFYAGCATFYDPPDADRRVMRRLAASVGARLRDEVDFRGAFTVDGIMGADGFVPTELNPRNGAGMRPLAASLDLPIQLLLDAAVQGSPIEFRSAELEALLLGAADEHRAGTTHRVLPVVLAPGSDELVVEPGRVRRTAIGEPPDLRVEIGPSRIGAFVRATFAADRRPVGASVAPVAARFWTWADERHDLGIGPLEPAVDVRGRAEPER